jgi:streptogramin lyase
MLLSLGLALGLGASALAAPVGQTGDFATPTASSGPEGIVAGPDGNLWFAEFAASKIGELNPVTHAITEFATPTAASGPLGITLAPDGNLWFTEWGASQIAEINPVTHAISEFPTPTASSFPVAITAGSDGNLWFTESGAGKVGELNPVTHATADFATPTPASLPFGIAAGPDGNVWFTEKPMPPGVSKIAEINPVTHAIGEFATPTASSQPNAIATGPDGSLWFTENAASKIGLIDPVTHAITEFPTPTAASEPVVIEPGPDGNLWFTEGHASQIGVLDAVTRTITGEFATPSASSGPVGIVTGADGNLWFTENAASKIGSIGAGAPAASRVAPSVTGTAQPGSALACSGATWSDWAGQPPSLGAHAWDGYQWLRDGGPIAGATSPAYTPAAGDVGHQLACTVTVTYPLVQTTVSATSAAVTVSPPLSGSLVGVSTSGATLSLTMSCQGAPGQSCTGPVALTSHVTTQAGKTVAVAATTAKPKPKPPKAKPKPKPAPKKTAVDTVASGSYSVATSSQVTVKLSLNATGKQLLAAVYRVPATMTIGGTTPVTKPATFSYARIRSPVSFTWTFNAHYSVAQELTISGLPAKSKVAVNCHGDGCPFSKRAFLPQGTRLALAADLRHRHLVPHATLQLEITATNDVGKVLTFTIRGGKQPLLAESCLPPGTSRPTACA